MTSALKLIIWLIVSNTFVSGKLLSRNKSIRSSSTRNKNRIEFVPQKAVDGNHTTDKDCCCAMTLFDKNAWFELDLGKKYLIEKIVVESVLYYFLGDDRQLEFFLVPKQDIQSVQPVKTVTSERHIAGLNFTLPEPRESRFLTMVRTSRFNEAFAVCELSVYGDCVDGWYGKDCDTLCSCMGQSCNKETGVCPSGQCLPGFRGAYCEKACIAGKYGSDCSKDCGKCLNQEPCNKTDGTCTRCAAGYSGLMCISQSSDGKVTYPDDMELLGIAIGGTTAVILMLEGVVAAVIYVIWKRKCKRRTEGPSRSAEVQQEQPRPDIGGLYELVNRSAYETEHPYGEGFSYYYEELESHYQNQK